MKFLSTFPGRLLLCAISACLVWFAFPNFLNKTLTPPTAFLGWVALVPFFLALRRTGPRRGFWLGLVFGFLQLGGVLYWIALLEEAKYLSGLAWFVLVFYLSLYFGAFGWIYGWLSERTKTSGLLTGPFLWVALEYLRGSRPWGGFNWGELGYTQAPYPAVLVFTTLAGVYGLTFLMVWFNASLAKFMELVFEAPDSKISGSPPWSKWKYLTFPLAVLLALLVYGNYLISSTQQKKTGTVVLLQPSIDQSVKWSKGYESETYNKISRLVAGIKGSKPDLVIWPETAAPSFLLTSPMALEKVKRIIRGTRVSNLVGCLDIRNENGKVSQYYNGAVHFDGKGIPRGVYHKRHLVPFGEFVPFQNYLTFLGPVIQDMGNIDFGLEYLKFEAGSFTYTPMICYEVIFPGDVQKAFKTGADALVNISNDAWYGRTASAYQHVMMAVVRSAEERKPLLRAANTGISLATDPFGRILASSNLFEETTLRADVMTVSGAPTLYSLVGNWFPCVCWLAVIFLVILAFRQKSQISDQGLIHEPEKK